jgi:hypothetical protein
MTRARFTTRNLEMQGFTCASAPSLERVAPWLRLTPSLSTAWIATGTALASPGALLGFSFVSALGASRRRHPFDRIHDVLRRRRAAGAPLPENPPPRRFAMALAAAWAAATAALFATGHRRGGRVAGGLLGLAGLSVATTHFCFGSWLYHRLARLARR